MALRRRLVMRRIVTVTLLRTGCVLIGAAEGRGPVSLTPGGLPWWLSKAVVTDIQCFDQNCEFQGKFSGPTAGPE